MAPQNKRVASPKKAGAGKRAKTQQHEILGMTLPPAVRQQLEPIFGGLGGCQDLPEPVKELLRNALPFCVAEPGEERHNYQFKVLELVADAFSKVATSKREDVESADQKVASQNADLEAAKSELESAEASENTQKAASDEQGKKCADKEAAVKAAQQAVDGAKQAVQDFHAKKAEMGAAVLSFSKVLEDLWKPLLEGHFPGVQWRKRDKMVVEFVKMVEPVHLEGSLIDAITVAFKIKGDQRGSFANLALEKAGEKLSEHNEQLKEKLAGLDTEEATLQEQVATATANLEAATAERKTEDEEHMTLQNTWVAAQEKAFNSRMALEKHQANLEAATLEASSLKQDLEAFQVVQSQLQALNETPVAVPEPVASPQRSEQQEEEVSAMAIATEVPAAVAAC